MTDQLSEFLKESNIEETHHQNSCKGVSMDSYRSYLDKINQALQQSSQLTGSMYFGELDNAQQEASFPEQFENNDYEQLGNEIASKIQKKANQQGPIEQKPFILPTIEEEEDLNDEEDNSLEQKQGFCINNSSKNDINIHQYDNLSDQKGCQYLQDDVEVDSILTKARLRRFLPNTDENNHINPQQLEFIEVQRENLKQIEQNSNSSQKDVLFIRENLETLFAVEQYNNFFEEDNNLSNQEEIIVEQSNRDKLQSKQDVPSSEDSLTPLERDIMYNNLFDDKQMQKQLIVQNERTEQFLSERINNGKIGYEKGYSYNTYSDQRSKRILQEQGKPNSQKQIVKHPQKLKNDNQQQLSQRMRVVIDNSSTIKMKSKFKQYSDKVNLEISTSSISSYGNFPPQMYGQLSNSSNEYRYAKLNELQQDKLRLERQKYVKSMKSYPQEEKQKKISNKQIDMCSKNNDLISDSMKKKNNLLSNSLKMNNDYYLMSMRQSSNYFQNLKRVETTHNRSFNMDNYQDLSTSYQYSLRTKLNQSEQNNGQEKLNKSHSKSIKNMDLSPQRPLNIDLIKKITNQLSKSQSYMQIFFQFIKND